MKVKDWLKNAEAALDDSGDLDAKFDARALVSDVLKTSLGGLFLVSEEELPRDKLSLLDKQLASRISGLPLQYVHGKAYFMGYEFKVDERVLIPRQDTELLCELAIARAEGGRKTLLDACTGSGAVAIAVALRCPEVKVFASDLSCDAINVARENAQSLGANVEFAVGDFLGAFECNFDIITCNPPYLTRGDMQTLQKEVRYEPSMALYGGTDGLDFYKRAFREAPSRLKKGATALFEVGMGQADALSSLGYVFKTYKDLNGIDRVIEFGGF